MRPPVVALLVMGLLLGGASLGRAEPPPTVDPSIGQVEVTLDLPKDEPYVGEMILLRMRTTIRGDVALDQIRQPPLTNFNWQQLGRDKPIRVMTNGFSVPGYERDIAIFPQQAGRLIIEPFVRHVTLIVGANDRVEADFASKPIYVDVQRHEGISTPGDWWLPAKSVTTKEVWTPSPDSIEPGKVARRILVIEATGTTADRLPPPPSMHAPGLITFTGPASRETILTPNGPVARAIYQWDVRPVTNTPAKLPAIHIPWFDITERRMRDTAVADQWVGYVGMQAGGHKTTASTFFGRFLTLGPLASGLAGLVWAVSAAGLFITVPRRGRSRGLGALAQAGRSGDAKALEAAILDLARSDPARWRIVEGAPSVSADLARLNASLYGPGALPEKSAAAMPSLPRLAAELIRLWRAAAPFTKGDDKDGLAPIDGDFAAGKTLSPGGIRDRLLAWRRQPTRS